jgi:hypothetical protein
MLADYGIGRMGGKVTEGVGKKFSRFKSRVSKAEPGGGL